MPNISPTARSIPSNPRARGRWHKKNGRKLTASSGGLHSALQAGVDKAIRRSDTLAAQFSSMGSMGGKENRTWPNQQLAVSLCGGPSAAAEGRNPELSLVFPTVEDVRQSISGYASGNSIPHAHKTFAKQTYPGASFHQKSPKFLPDRVSSRATADLHQPPVRATAAVCRRPLGHGTDSSG